jgi:hypothetical protein
LGTLPTYGLAPEVSTPVDHEIRALVWALPLHVGVFLRHPLLPLGASVFSVTEQTAVEPYVAKRLDPDRVRQVGPERLASGGDAFDDQVRRGSNLDWLGGSAGFQIVGVNRAVRP